MKFYAGFFFNFKDTEFKKHILSFGRKKIRFLKIFYL